MEASVNNPEHQDNIGASDNSLPLLVMFAAKTIIVVSVCTTAILVGSSFVSRHFERILSSFSNVADRTTKAVDGTFWIGGGPFWAKLESELDRIAVGYEHCPPAMGILAKQFVF